MEAESGWFTDDIVEYNGKIYDAFSERLGSTLQEFSGQWGYGSDILKWTPVR